MCTLAAKFVAEIAVIERRYPVHATPTVAPTPSTQYHEYRDRRTAPTAKMVMATAKVVPASNKTEEEVLILVLSRRPAFETRTTIRETWGRGCTNIRFVVGSCCRLPQSTVQPWTCIPHAPRSASQQEVDRRTADCFEEDRQLERERNQFNDMVFARTVDVYRHLPQKLKEGYQWAMQNSLAEWIIKTDDDSVVRVKALTKYLRTTLDASVPTVYGSISKGWGVHRAGKWAERTYAPSTYPAFPLGSHGHVVSRPVAQWIADNQHGLINYQGEDVSIGIWLDGSPLKSKIKWVASKHTANHGNCFDPSLWMIGHDISAAKMRNCFGAAAKSVSIKPLGRLGNLMFEHASAYGLAQQANVPFCIDRGNSEFSFSVLRETFVGPFPPYCTHRGAASIAEAGYAMHDARIAGMLRQTNTPATLNGYFQSWRYFEGIAPAVRSLFTFKPDVMAQARTAINRERNQQYVGVVGIHVRRGDYMKYGYLRFPPASYFESAMVLFPRHQFIVLTEDIAWCREQLFFMNNAVKIMPAGRAGPVDMAILTLCDGIILTLGTFGWWGGWLAPNARVMYDANVFKLEHPTNKGKVRYDDHFMPEWTAVGSNNAKNGWDSHLPSNNAIPDFSVVRESLAVATKYDWAATELTCRQHLATTKSEMARFYSENGQGGKMYEHPERLRMNATIVELGAFSGRDIGVFFQKASDRNIRTDGMAFYLYEPATVPFSALRSKYDHRPNVHLVNTAVGNRITHLCVQGTSDALALRDNVSFCSETFPVLDIADVLKPHNHVDLLHINCEGCEVPIIQRILATSSTKVHAIEVQFHPQHISAKAYCDAATDLFSHGYRLTYHFAWVWELWERREPPPTLYNTRQTRRHLLQKNAALLPSSFPLGGVMSPASANVHIALSDKIMQKGQWDGSPIVIRKYKLLFWTVPKNSCSVFKRLFRRMEGYADWRTRYNFPRGYTHDGAASTLPHEPGRNGLTYLYNLNGVEATAILNDKTWTKAIFWRDPTERFLSAYLDKIGAHSRLGWNFSTFVTKVENGKRDVHWNPQCDLIDCNKWLPVVNFVGYVETAAKDTELLLRRIGAWDTFGSSGWGLDAGVSIFQGQKDYRHATGARGRMHEFYADNALKQRVELLMAHDFRPNVKEMLHHAWARNAFSVNGGDACTFPVPLYNDTGRYHATFKRMDTSKRNELLQIMDKLFRFSEVNNKSMFMHLDSGMALGLYREGTLKEDGDVDVRYGFAMNKPLILPATKNAAGLKISLNNVATWGDPANPNIGPGPRSLSVEEVASVNSQLCTVTVNNSTFSMFRDQKEMLRRFYGPVWFVRMPFKGVWPHMMSPKTRGWAQSMSILNRMDIDKNQRITVTELDQYTVNDGINKKAYADQISAIERCKAAAFATWMFQFTRKPYKISSTQWKRDGTPFFENWFANECNN